MGKGEEPPAMGKGEEPPAVVDGWGEK